MLVLKENDYLEVNLNSLIADYDRKILSNLYQPIVGYKAISLYLTLLTEAENQKINSLISHGTLFKRMQITAGDFVDSRKLLEAVGLLKTFVSDLTDNKMYQYELYAPKTPKIFFDNTLLYGMLIKQIGESDANKLKTIYSINRQPEGQEITASFVEVFSPNFDDPAFRKAMVSGGNLSSRQSAKLITGFKYELFFQHLSAISQIKPESFSRNDMKEIERLALLYGVNEENASGIVAEIYNPKADKEHRIDFNLLAEKFMELSNYQFLLRGDSQEFKGTVSGSSNLASKINLMETVSPKEYLTYLQNGGKPAYSDLKILNDISVKFHLPNGVINALIDYVLTVNDNVLSKAFAEKIAGSLARENIKTAVDAMNYLKKISSKRKKKKEISPETEKEPEVTINPEESEEDLDWDKMIKDLEDDNGED